MTKRKALVCDLCGGEMRIRKLGEYIDHVCKRCSYTSPQTHMSHGEELARKVFRRQSRLIARYMVRRSEFAAAILHRDAALSAVNEERDKAKARVLQLLATLDRKAKTENDERDALVEERDALKARVAELESAQPAQTVTTKTVTTPDGFTVTVIVRKGDA